LNEQVLERPVVVVDKPVVDAGLGGEAPSGDARVADFDEQPFGGVKESFLRLGAWNCLSVSQLP
jgi:hypothetical protein